jgi:hypothetical protein
VPVRRLHGFASFDTTAMGRGMAWRFQLISFRAWVVTSFCARWSWPGSTIPSVESPMLSPSSQLLLLWFEGSRAWAPCRGSLAPDCQESGAKGYLSKKLACPQRLKNHFLKIVKL